MKTSHILHVFLGRHATAVSLPKGADPTLDCGRPLTEKGGMNEGANLGTLVRKHTTTLDAVITSPALRCKQTTGQVLTSFPGLMAAKVVEMPELYPIVPGFEDITAMFEGDDSRGIKGLLYSPLRRYLDVFSGHSENLFGGLMVWAQNTLHNLVHPHHDEIADKPEASMFVCAHAVCIPALLIATLQLMEEKGAGDLTEQANLAFDTNMAPADGFYLKLGLEREHGHVIGCSSVSLTHLRNELSAAPVPPVFEEEPAATA